MKQLTIYVEKQVGNLSELLQLISKLEINVRSVSTERTNMSEVRFIVSNSEKAQEVLRNIRYYPIWWRLL